MIGWGSGERQLESGDLFKMDLPGVPERLCGARQEDRVKEDLMVSGLGNGRTGLPSAEMVKAQEERSGGVFVDKFSEMPTGHTRRRGPGRGHVR